MRARPAAWTIFKKHHYLNTSISKVARCFVASVVIGDAPPRPAAFSSVISFPHPSKPGWIEHRTVCLPDFQGVGIGNALSEFIGGCFAATGKPYRSTTSNPAMIHHRARSPLWRMHRKPSMVAAGGKRALRNNVGATMHSSRGRITAGFRYVGPTYPAEARAFGLM